MDRPDVSIIITTAAYRPSLTRCLAHLEGQTFPSARFEVLIADLSAEGEAGHAVERYAGGAPMRIRCLYERGGVVRGRNRAAEAAQGRWVYFLEEDLLASPHLVERHVLAHESHGRPTAVVGAVARHPQMTPDALSHWHLPEEYPEPPEGTRLHFLDWHAANLSVPRQALLSAGGFDEGFADGAFADAELGYRLTRSGVHGYFVRDATAYYWQRATLTNERRRHYVRGYNLYTLAQKTRPDDVFMRFPVARGAWRRRYEELMMPLLVQACEDGDADVRLLGDVYARVLRHALCRGYEDASRGRAPQPGPAAPAAALLRQ